MGRRLRALFVHPAYPNQFTAVAEALARGDGGEAFECACLVHRAALAAGERPTVPHYAFESDGAVDLRSYPLSCCFESGMRTARGLSHTLAALARRQRFDVCVAYAGFGASLPLRALFGGAVVAYSELPGFQTTAARAEFPMTLDQLLTARGFEALNYLSALDADLCIVPSEHARRLFPVELHGKLRVQMEGFRADPRAPGDRRERADLDLPPGSPLVGFFARTLEAVRGFDVFVQVAARLRRRMPEVRFLVIGEERTLYGNEGAYLGPTGFRRWALARAGLAEDAFLWRPFLPYAEFRRHIACLDLAVLPLIEGAANWNLFEAMAVGLPILSSNRCFVPEAIRSGREGILLDPGDPEGFAREAAALLRDRRRARLLGRAAAERIRRRFSVENAARGYAAILREAVALHRSRTFPPARPSATPAKRRGTPRRVAA